MQLPNVANYDVYIIYCSLEPTSLSPTECITLVFVMTITLRKIISGGKEIEFFSLPAYITLP